MSVSDGEVSVTCRGGHWVPTMDLERPVFILTCARSGSTLLRFILDAHPELACPAETEVASACAKLAFTWGAMQGINPRGPFAQQARTSEASAAIRRAIDDAARSYLERQGKTRWCDKSLDNVVNADLLVQMWPQAKFICLTRHCMDVIASAAESTRWGLAGFGFGAYAMRHGNNTVAAVGEYWIDRTSAILRFQQRYPRRSHRLRYEDLVARPDETITKLLAFLEVAGAPDIAEACFRVAHEPGQGDEKIWLTSRIHSESVGRGGTVPVQAMPRPIRGRVNKILAELGHDPVTDEWNLSSARRPAPPASASDTEEAASPPTDASPASIPEVSPERLELAARRWPQLEGRVLGVSFRAGPTSVQTQRWRLGPGDGHEVARDAQVVVDGDTATWQAVLRGEENFAAACLTSRLSVLGVTQTGWPALPDEAHAVAFLLGLDTVPVAISEASAAAAEARRTAQAVAT
jgi:hypothetical protein